jgi:hypothetical protein
VSVAPARATTLVTFDGTGYTDGKVQYSISGSTLTITLKNTATSPANDQPAPTDGLAGVLFRLPTGSLQAQAALIPSGNATVQANKCDNPSCAGATDVGGEVGSQAAPFAAAGAPAGVTTGSSGQIAAYGAQFGGTDLDSTSEMGLKKDALTQSSVTFALTIVGGTLLENNQISNWSVVFGTAWGEGTVRNLGALNQFDVNAVPEPSSLLLLGGGLTAAAAAMRRRRTRAAKAD